MNYKIQLTLAFMAGLFTGLMGDMPMKLGNRIAMYIDSKLFMHKYKSGKAREGVDFHTCGQYVECRYNDCERNGCNAKTPI